MEKCEAAAKEIRGETLNHRVNARHLDLASLKSIREFAAKVTEGKREASGLVREGLSGQAVRIEHTGQALEPSVGHCPFLFRLWIFQARILGCIAISFSRGASQIRDQTQVSRIAGKSFTV